jgi:hypothetical protein
VTLQTVYPTPCAHTRLHDNSTNRGSAQHSLPSTPPIGGNMTTTEIEDKENRETKLEDQIEARWTIN